MLIAEFTVTGIPVSHQTANREALQRWKRRVRRAARGVGNGSTGLPVTSDVEVHVVYYYDSAPAQIPDGDNMLKPIQDALQGILYVNDRQVTDASCRKRDLNGSYKVRRMRRPLSEGFVEGEEFVHIVVSEAPAPEDL